MPREQPLAQDLMQEALSNNGSHVEQFLSPTIFPGQQQASLLLVAWEHRHQLNDLSSQEEEYVSVHLNPLIFHSQTNHGNLCKSDLIFAALIKSF